MKKQHTAKSKIGSLIQKCDLYGHPINLTYNGEETFKSILGGVFSILYSLAVLAWLVASIAGAINHDGSITTSSYFRDTTLDNATYSLNKSNFDIALKLINYN